MTFVKTSAFVLGFLGAVALGVLMGPSVKEHAASISTMATRAVPDVGLPIGATAAKSSLPAATRRSAAQQATVRVISLTPELEKRLQPLLNRGADMTVASDGCRDAEQFAALAHAARNTDIPFMLLKHRVLNEGKSLAAAIHTSKPDVNAAIQANLARAEAKSDIAAARSEVAAILSSGAALGA